MKPATYLRKTMGNKLAIDSTATLDRIKELMGCGDASCEW